MLDKLRAMLDELTQTCDSHRQEHAFLGRILDIHASETTIRVRALIAGELAHHRSAASVRMGTPLTHEELGELFFREPDIIEGLDLRERAAEGSRGLTWWSWWRSGLDGTALWVPSTWWWRPATPGTAGTWTWSWNTQV